MGRLSASYNWLLIMVYEISRLLQANRFCASGAVETASVHDSARPRADRYNTIVSMVKENLKSSAPDQKLEPKRDGSSLYIYSGSRTEV